MEVLDLLRVAVRWSHAVAAVAWVGGSLFYLFALSPAVIGLDAAGRGAVMAGAGRQFQEMVRLAIFVFLFTGVILTVDRLTQPSVSVTYVAVLGVKIALSLWMFWIAQQLRRAPAPPGSVSHAKASPPRAWFERTDLLLVLGLVVYLLAILLNVIFETELVQAQRL